MKYLLPSDYQNDRYWTRMDLVIFVMLSFFNQCILSLFRSFLCSVIDLMRIVSSDKQLFSMFMVGTAKSVLPVDESTYYTHAIEDCR